MPHSAASDLGLHCLPVTHLGVSSLHRVTHETLPLILMQLLITNMCLVHMGSAFKGTRKGDSFCVFLFCFSARQVPSEKGFTLKGKNLLPGSKFFPF